MYLELLNLKKTHLFNEHFATPLTRVHSPVTGYCSHNVFNLGLVSTGCVHTHHRKAKRQYFLSKNHKNLEIMPLPVCPFAHNKACLLEFKCKQYRLCPSTLKPSQGGQNWRTDRNKFKIPSIASNTCFLVQLRKTKALLTTWKRDKFKSHRNYVVKN